MQFNNIFLNAWNKCLDYTQEQLKNEFNENNQLFFRAMHYIQHHPSKLAKNIDLSAKIISSIPEKHVTINSVQKILSFLRASGCFSQQATFPLIPYFGRPHPQLLNVLKDCIEKGKPSLALALLDHGFPFTNEMLFSACSNGLSTVVLKLIEKGADVNLADKHGNTPLIEACCNGHTELALKLIEKGADVNLADKYENTPLIAACHLGLSEVALKLIEEGADVNHDSGLGNTPLIQACFQKLNKVALKLIEKGADVNCVNRGRFTPLSLTCGNGFPDVILAILKKGAKWNLDDPKQRLTLEFLGSDKAKELMSYCLEGNFLGPNHKKDHSLLAIALLCGDKGRAYEIYSKMTSKEKIDIMEILKSRFETNDSLQDYFDNLCWEINPDHYHAGESLVEKPPQPLPDRNLVTLLEQELAVQKKFPKSAKIREMLTKITKRTRIMGLGDKSDDEVKQWYDTFSLYLIHVLDAYKIGQKEGDSENKTMVLECLADMEEYCFPRWMDEIKQLYTFRPHENVGDDPAKEFSLEDKGHQLNRNLRKNIVTTKLLKFEIGNVHEPNFLLDLLGNPLDLRIEKIHDPYAHFEDIHSLDEALATFEKCYTPSALIDNLTAHLQSQQAQEKSSHDPLDLKYPEVYEWLRERVAIGWKAEEYRELPSTAKKMQEEGKTPEDIKAFLSEYGIEWDAGETLPEAFQRLSQQEALLNSQIKQLESMLAKSPENRALQNRIKSLVEKRESLERLKAKVSSFSSDAEKTQFLDERGYINKPQPLEEVLTEGARRRAQIDIFFDREVFHEGKFTRSAAIHLLVSWGVLHPRSDKK
jgi:Ankyrin repeats (3 copies)